MKLLNALLAPAVLVASTGANAFVVGSLTGSGSNNLTLSSPTIGVAGTGGTLSGSVSATITGGTVYSSDMPFADDVLPGENFLAVGPTAGGFGVPNTSTLTFVGPGISDISFLWGSPQTFNTLTVNSTGPGPNSQIFTPTSMGFPITNGDETFNELVHFTAGVGSLITSLAFTSSENSFEVGRFTTTAISAPVPEPQTYALLLLGLGVMGFTARRRKKPEHTS